MSTTRRFEDLEVWKRARELAKLVYRLTEAPQFNRDFRLRNQMRNAAVSILSNIAEGFSRHTDREFTQFLYISRGSAAELQSQSYIALDQEYFSCVSFEQLYEETDHTSRMLSNLIKYLRTSARTHQRFDE
ncbi:four helix bundle protein [bacterium]|nr:four helix bundle protein [bacterium]